MKRALFVGRFQPFHNAHLADIKKILKESDEVIIAIGSSQEKNTSENPFSCNERKQMIADALKKHNIKNFKIHQVPDFHDNNKWTDYIKKNLPKFDSVYSGNQITLNCFKKDDKVKKIKLIKGISSTKIRNLIIKNKNWERLVPKEVSMQINKIKGAERIKKIYFRI